jgi:hypothetical protein
MYHYIPENPSAPLDPNNPSVEKLRTLIREEVHPLKKVSHLNYLVWEVFIVVCTVKDNNKQIKNQDAVPHQDCCLLAYMYLVAHGLLG